MDCDQRTTQPLRLAQQRCGSSHTAWTCSRAPTSIIAATCADMEGGLIEPFGAGGKKPTNRQPGCCTCPVSHILDPADGACSELRESLPTPTACAYGVPTGTRIYKHLDFRGRGLVCQRRSSIAVLYSISPRAQPPENVIIESRCSCACSSLHWLNTACWISLIWWNTLLHDNSKGAEFSHHGT